MNQHAGLFLMVGLALTTLRAEAEPNLLINPGLETGDFTGWTVGGNSSQSGVALDGTPIANVDPEFTPAFQNVRSGRFAGNAIVTDVHAPIQLITLTQVIAVQPNQNYDVGLWLGNDSPHAFGISIDNSHTQIFIDDSPVLGSGSRNIPPGSGPGDFVELHRTFDTGSRTSITVMFEINGSGTAPAAASFDDFFLMASPVPEPTLLVVLSLGLAAGWLRFGRDANNGANVA